MQLTLGLSSEQLQLVAVGIAVLLYMFDAELWPTCAVTCARTPCAHRALRTPRACHAAGADGAWPYRGVGGVGGGGGGRRQMSTPR